MSSKRTKINCPSCDSDNTGNTKRLKPGFGWLLFLIGFTFLNYKKEFYCYDCDLTFELDNKE
ncbi:MAG: transposase-like protein [Saprospiraceae bacterium]|jgi:transposase-like protein